MLKVMLANKSLEVWRHYTRKVRSVAYRQGITAVDKITDFVAASVTLANVAGTQGSLVFNTAYYMTAVPGNKYGPTVPAAIDSLTTTNDAASTHVIACTIAQATGAEWYDLFLSTDTAPKWVGRVTEAERAAGGEVLTVGAVTAGASAGIINIGIVGTGIQTTNAILAQNNAYLPAGVPSIDCRGYEKAVIKVALTLTDLRSAPTLRLLPFGANSLSTDNKHPYSIGTVPLLGALGQPLLGEFRLEVLSDPFLSILVDTISGQGASVDIWVELVR